MRGPLNRGRRQQGSKKTPKSKKPHPFLSNSHLFPVRAKHLLGKGGHRRKNRSGWLIYLCGLFQNKTSTPPAYDSESLHYAPCSHASLFFLFFSPQSSRATTSVVHSRCPAVTLFWTPAPARRSQERALGLVAAPLKRQLSHFFKTILRRKQGTPTPGLEGRMTFHCTLPLTPKCLSLGMEDSSKCLIRIFLKSPILTCFRKQNKQSPQIRNSHCGSEVTNLTSILEEAGWIPDLIQWVKDPAVP